MRQATRRALWRFTAIPIRISRRGPVADYTTVGYVDPAGSDTLNHGTSPADAFQTIQKGIDTVTSGGTVHVAAGLYTPNFNTVPKSVMLLGAVVSSGAPQPTQGPRRDAGQQRCPRQQSVGG